MDSFFLSRLPLWGLRGSRGGSLDCSFQSGQVRTIQPLRLREEAGPQLSRNSSGNAAAVNSHGNSLIKFIVKEVRSTALEPLSGSTCECGELLCERFEECGKRCDQGQIAGLVGNAHSVTMVKQLCSQLLLCMLAVAAIASQAAGEVGEYMPTCESCCKVAAACPLSPLMPHCVPSRS